MKIPVCIQAGDLQLVRQNFGTGIVCSIVTNMHSKAVTEVLDLVGPGKFQFREYRNHLLHPLSIVVGTESHPTM